MTNKGFTLLEVIIAIFLITVGVGGAFALIQRTITFTAVTSSQLTATYLAQEGIERVRNTRDGNWLRQRTDPTIPWDADLPAGDWPAETLLGRFQRRITISKPEVNKMLVSVLVSWTERGRTHQVTAQTKLYNWR